MGVARQGEKRDGWFWWRVGVVGFYVLIWGLVWFGRERMPPEFPLFYSLPYGEEQLGDRLDVYRVMGWLGIVIGLNELVGWWLKRRGGGVLSKILWVGVGWVEVLWVIALFKIWGLVGW
jgi:hypothetical protein